MTEGTRSRRRRSVSSGGGRGKAQGVVCGRPLVVAVVTGEEGSDSGALRRGGWRLATGLKHVEGIGPERQQTARGT